jgi:SAM-dependent methyltransferase
VPITLDDWREILVVSAAADTGLLHHFAVAGAPADAAVALGLDARATRVVCRALHELGHLTGDEDGRFQLSERGRALIDTDHGDPIGGIALSVRDMRAHLDLPQVMRSGTPRDDLSRGDEATRVRFMRAMRDVAAPRAQRTAAAMPAPRAGATLLDVGGAPGTYAAAFAAAGWEVTVVDQAAQIEVEAENLGAIGAAAVVGDMTRELPEGRWDAVYLGNVVHLFGPEQAAALVARAGAAIAPGGVLAIQEVVLGRATVAACFGVTMLLGTEAGEAYADDDYRGWMADAGCPLEQVVEVQQNRHHLMLGRRR